MKENTVNETEGSTVMKRTILLLPLVCSMGLLPAAQSSQKTFLTPQAAADEVIKAAGNYDVSALLKIFGPHGEDFISSADPVQDKGKSLAFAELARKKNSISTDPSKPNRAVLLVGDEDWPFPVP